MENAKGTSLMRAILENKAAAESRQANSQTVYSCEEILGSMKPVQNFAAFFTANKIELQLLRKVLLMDFIETKITTEEKEAFQLALDLFLGFFEKSDDEVDLYILDANKKNNAKKSVDSGND